MSLIADSRLTYYGVGEQFWFVTELDGGEWQTVTDESKTQMRFDVRSVQLMDAHDHECDPYAIPPNFFATTIAIHLDAAKASSAHLRARQ